MDDVLVAFRYVFAVPRMPASRIAGRPCDMRDPAPLLGSQPSLTWTAYTPDPWRLYARVALASSVDGRRVTFSVDRRLLGAAKEGDRIYVGASTRLGLSIVRGDELIAAAGASRALATIPLGNDVRVRFPAPHDEAVKHIPEGGSWRIGRRHDAPEHPTDITAGGVRLIWWTGRPSMGPYDVLLQSGIRDAEACLSIERKGRCPQTVAHETAELLQTTFAMEQ